MFSDPPLTKRPTQAGIDALAGVVLLLRAASLETSRRLFEAGEVDGFATLHAHQILVVAREAEALLGDDFDYGVYEPPVERDPVLLLCAAEELLRVEPAPDYPRGTIGVVLGVPDLVGDAEYLAGR